MIRCGRAVRDPGPVGARVAGVVTSGWLAGAICNPSSTRGSRTMRWFLENEMSDRPPSPAPRPCAQSDDAPAADLAVRLLGV